MTARPTYRARTIKRSRRTSAQVEQLNRQILDVFAQDHPQSVRHCYYRMTDPRLPEPVEKTDRGYRHVQGRTVILRREGRLPYGHVSDATRTGYFTDTFNGSADFMRRMAGLYRGDLWARSQYRCEVWCESRSIAGVILADCRELAVSLYPAGGFTSLSLAHEAAIYINEADDGRPLFIFFIGDYDPAGVLIDKAIERELREHLNPGVVMTFERIGITREQVETYDLPTKPRKDGDKRSPEIEYTVEAEAMPAKLLRSILRERIESLLPPGALRVTKVAEQSEREHLLLMADLCGGDA